VVGYRASSCSRALGFCCPRRRLGVAARFRAVSAILAPGGTSSAWTPNRASCALIVPLIKCDCGLRNSWLRASVTCALAAQGAIAARRLPKLSDDLTKRNAEMQSITREQRSRAKPDDQGAFARCPPHPQADGSGRYTPAITAQHELGVSSYSRRAFSHPACRSTYQHLVRNDTWIVPEMLAYRGWCIPIMPAFVCAQCSRKQSMLIGVSDTNDASWLNVYD
jgi:hypothetical protein